jgi:hypothetical protein
VTRSVVTVTSRRLGCGWLVSSRLSADVGSPDGVDAVPLADTDGTTVSEFATVTGTFTEKGATYVPARRRS